MRDRTSGPGDDRHRTERLSRAPGEEWTPEQDSPATDEWSPGDAPPGRRTGSRLRPEERPPSEPGQAGSTGGWISGAGPSGAGPGGAGPGGADPGADGAGGAGAEPGEGFADRPRAGREGLTGDDRAPEDTPAPPPGPAGAGAGQWHRTEQAGQWHGTEGLRPGTEDMGAGADEGFGASHRAEREAISEEDRMPDNGLGAPAPGGASQREATTTDSPGRDTWPTAPGAPAHEAPRSDTTPATGPVGTEPGTAATAATGATGSEPATPATGPVGTEPGTPATGALGTGPGTPATGALGTEPGTPVGASAPASTPPTAQPAPSGQGSPLLAREEVEEWQRRMREVVGGFVDQPKGAVERADRTLEEIAARFSDAVTRRRRTLRMSWEGAEERGPGAETDTEQLRLALRDYRELAERLLRG